MELKNVYVTDQAQTINLPVGEKTVTMVTIMLQPEGDKRPRPFYAIVEQYEPERKQPAVYLLHALRGHRLNFKVDEENPYPMFGDKIADFLDE